MITPLMMSLIKKHEGLRLKPYTDADGKVTIGWGRNLTDNGVSEPESERMFGNDIANAAQDACKFFPGFYSLDEVRQAVLIDMAFALGLPRLLEFTQLKAALLSGDYTTADQQIINSAWCAQVKSRAYEDGVLMRTGVWQS